MLHDVPGDFRALVWPMRSYKKACQSHKGAVEGFLYGLYKAAVRALGLGCKAQCTYVVYTIYLGLMVPIGTPCGPK